jgi:hypothetical protein
VADANLSIAQSTPIERVDRAIGGCGVVVAVLGGVEDIRQGLEVASVMVTTTVTWLPVLFHKTVMSKTASRRALT